MPVELWANFVVKRRSSLDLARREFEKSRAAYVLSRSTGLFTVPEPINIDALTGEMRFERLRGYMPLRTVLSASDPVEQARFAQRLADILRAVHELLPLESERVSETWSRPHQGGAPGRLHGDFTVDNILYDTGSDRIAVVDWSSAGWLGTDACVGPVEIDLVGFLISLYNQKVWQRVMIRHPEDAATAFLRQYRNDGTSLVDHALCRTFESNAALYLSELVGKSGPSAIFYTPRIRQLGRRIRRLHREGTK